MSVRDERAYRLQGFLQGALIRLADGQLWMFPPPPASPGATCNDATDGGALGSDYVALLKVVREVDDLTERLRAELALAIHLLAKNYELNPEDYQELFGWASGSPELIAGQQAFHVLASTHLDSFSARFEDAPTQRHGMFRKLIRVAQTVSRLAARWIPASQTRSRRWTAFLAATGAVTGPLRSLLRDQIDPSLGEMGKGAIALM